MIITVKNTEAFRVAQANTAEKDFQASFRGVYIEPGGCVAGTDGYTLAYHEDAVEPFEGEPIIIRPQRKIPLSTSFIEIDTEAKLIRYGSKGLDNVMTLEVIDAAFRDFRQVAPTEGVMLSGPALGFNIGLMERMVSQLNKGNRREAYWQPCKDGLLRLVTDDPGLVCLLAPLRTALERSRQRELPLPVDGRRVYLDGSPVKEEEAEAA